MNYISITQFANKFNVSERYVRRLCSEGMIVGAAKIGRTWKKQCLKVTEGLQKFSKQLMVYNIDASSNEELLKIKKKLSKYKISKIVFSENNPSFKKVEENDFEKIQKNFRAPIYATVLAMSVFYPLMDKTNIVAILHKKATTIGLPNETIFSAAYHGLNGFLDSILASCENDNKISNVLKVYSGSIESEFWNSDDAKNVINKKMENKILPRDLATLAIDSINTNSKLSISELHIRRIKE